VRRWAERVRRERLPNGLTLLVHPAPLPAVAVVVHVRAGFFDEPDEVAGISHVLEHLVFKGSPRFGPGDLARTVKAAGGYLNAFTSYAATQYHAVLPPEGLAAGAEALADAVRAPSVDPDELRRELGVIVEEAKRKRDTPGAMAQETLHALLFDVHRVRRWRIGEEAAIAAFTRGEVAGYHRDRYVPARTIVAVAGAVEAEAALDLLRATWADWAAAADPPPPGPEEPPRRGRRARTLRGDVQAAELRAGWRAVPPLHPDAPALDLLAATLGAGRGSRLAMALREPGLATGVGASLLAPAEIGLFTLGATLDPRHLDAALEAMARETAELAAEGPSTDDLERARALLLAGRARTLESAEGQASALATAEALRDVALLDEEEARLRGLTGAEVQAAAARWLEPGSVAALALLPHGFEGELDEARLAAAFGAEGGR
jgi:zinc protease